MPFVLAPKLWSKLSLNKDSLVIELGGNDGYLLSQFQKLNNTDMII